jgi:hypothetical protein
MRRMVAAGCAFALAGCGATKPPDDSARTKAIERATQQTAEQTYLNVIDAMRHCYAKPTFGIQADYFPDGKSSGLRLIFSTGTSLQELVRVQIDSAPGGAIVRAQYTPAEPGFAQAVDAWVKGDASNCPLG